MVSSKGDVQASSKEFRREHVDGLQLTRFIVTDRITRGNDARGEVSMDANIPVPSTPEPKSCSVKPVCPVCGGSLFEIRAKLQCSRCHTICETCCEGGRG